MKRKGIIQTSLVLFLGLAWSLCAVAGDEHEPRSLEKIKAEAAQLVNSLGAYSADQKNKVLDMLDKNLAQLDGRIEQLEQMLSERWSEMSTEARAKARGKLREMKQHRIELAESYGSLRSDSGDAWDKLKQGFSDAYDDITSAWKAAEQELKQ